MLNHNMSYVADGDIQICRVVALSDTDDFMVKQCTDVLTPYGIAQEWVQGSPGTPFASGDGDIAAEDTRPIKIYGPGSIAVAAQKATSPTLAAGAAVTADSNGFIVAASAGGTAVGWVHEGAGAGFSKLRVFVWPHTVAGS